MDIVALGIVLKHPGAPLTINKPLGPLVLGEVLLISKSVIYQRVPTFLISLHKHLLGYDFCFPDLKYC